MPFAVPEHLETKRLLLRPFALGDWQALHQYYGDPVATEYTTGHALTEGETWRMLCTIVGHWQLRQYGPYALEERVSGKVIGLAGFWYPNDWPDPEIKWALARDYWGNGFASEAARKLQEVGREHLPDLQLISFIRTENARSIQLAKAVGARLEKEVLFRGATWSIYRHPRT